MTYEETDLGVYDALFHDIPWSTGDVFPLTLQRIQSAGLRHAHLARLRDVDTIDDLNHYA